MPWPEEPALITSPAPLELLEVGRLTAGPLTLTVWLGGAFNYARVDRVKVISTDPGYDGSEGAD